MSVLTRMKLRSRTKAAEDLVVGLMGITSSLMADDEFDAASPRVTAYLRDKPTAQISDSIDGVEGMLAQGARSPLGRGLLNPDMLVNVRDSLKSELRRRERNS